MSAQTGFTVAQASYTRVFIIEGRARPDHSPSYESCLRMLGVSRGFGDIERVVQTVRCGENVRHSRSQAFHSALHLYIR